MNKKVAKELHFSLGPVQAFVGQSRRTRDLWASSFLLSYLAGHAIDAVIEDPKEMILPDVSNNRLYAAVRAVRRGEPVPQNAPRHGTLPNRFVVAVDDVDRAVEAATVAIGRAWTKITERVWEKYVEPIAEFGNGTREIWERQIADFWQVSWAVENEQVGAQVLDRRKNWRSHVDPVEPGDKCTMMHRWQELSGHIRSHDKRAQDSFWQQMCAGPEMGGLDLGDDERLCAIALVKRLYPKLAKHVIGWEIGVTNWPSTAYLAAAPWVARAARNAPDATDEYASEVLAARPGARGEWNTNLRLLEPFADRDFVTLDGNFFLDDALANDSATPLDDEAARAQLEADLGRIRGDLDDRPSSYYALLLMDGDKMGALLREAGKVSLTSEVSQALGSFAMRVDDIVHRHDGIAVYAGGDDVLAMLTLPCALRCAVALRDAYTDAFTEVCDSLALATTISGGLVYAHYKTPLRDVLREAHHLLDDVAKETTGRDSLAITALKSSGKQSQWSVPWDHLTSAAVHPTLLDELADRLSGGAHDDDVEFSSSFIYAMRRLFGLLDDAAHWEPGAFVETVEGLDVEALLMAEYSRSRGADVDEAEARERIQALVKCCKQVRRDRQRDELSIDNERIGFDAPLLARLLAEEGHQFQPDEESH
ncbi:MAG: type III-B CRISPR-associated protein Cas10/Cmr2 [Persicimonas sp.]